MNQSTEEKNKTLVLDAFETLFNRRDNAGPERYWSPKYIQHSAHIPPGNPIGLPVAGNATEMNPPDTRITYSRSTYNLLRLHVNIFTLPLLC